MSTKKETWKLLFSPYDWPVHQVNQDHNDVELHATTVPRSHLERRVLKFGKWSNALAENGS